MKNNSSLFSNKSENLYNAIKNYIDFRQECKNNAKVYHKVYLIKSILFESLNKKLGVKIEDYNIYKNKEKFMEILEGIPINIFPINNLKDLLHNIPNFKIVNEKTIENLDVNDKKDNYNCVDYKVISAQKQQIIFKDGSKLKITIKDDNKTIYNVVERPYNGYKIDNNDKLSNGSSVKEKEGNNNLNDFSFEIFNGVDQKIIDLYKKIYECFKQQNQIDKLINGIIDIEKFNNYLIINKKWFNKLIKFFEEDDIYKNDYKIIYFFDELTNIKELSDIELQKNYNKRKTILEDEELFKPELVIESNIKYPKEFIIIEKDLINDLNINFKDNYLYEIAFGENYIFIKDKLDSNMIFVCSRDKLYFKVNVIFKFKKDKDLKNYIEKYIKNKHGLHHIEKKNGDILFIDYKKEYEDNTKNILTSNGNNINYLYKYNPYIKALLLSFIEIKELNNFMTKGYNENKKNQKMVSLISKFMKYYIVEDKNYKDVINEIEYFIKEQENEIIANINFQKLIDFILSKLHEELNTKRQLLIEITQSEVDQKQGYAKFKEQYCSSNNSKIKDLFYGIKEQIINNSCCNIQKYQYDILKYIYIKNEELKHNDDLKDLIYKWENKRQPIKDNYCKRCNFKSDTILEERLIDYPEVLIIILDNHINGTKIKIESEIKTDKFEYHLISCIVESDLKDNFNIICSNKSSWNNFDNKNKYKQYMKDLKDLYKYAKVFFFKKGNRNKEFKGTFVGKNEESDDSYLNEDYFYNNKYSSVNSYYHNTEKELINESNLKLQNNNMLNISIMNNNEKDLNKSKFLIEDENINPVINLSNNNNNQNYNMINNSIENKNNVNMNDNMNNNNMNNNINNNMNNTMNNNMNNSMNNNMNNNNMNNNMNDNMNNNINNMNNNMNINNMNNNNNYDMNNNHINKNMNNYMNNNINNNMINNNNMNNNMNNNNMNNNMNNNNMNNMTNNNMNNNNMNNNNMNMSNRSNTNNGFNNMNMNINLNNMNNDFNNMNNNFNNMNNDFNNMNMNNIFNNMNMNNDSNNMNNNFNNMNNDSNNMNNNFNNMNSGNINLNNNINDLNMNNNSNMNNFNMNSNNMNSNNMNSNNMNNFNMNNFNMNNNNMNNFNMNNFNMNSNNMNNFNMNSNNMNSLNMNSNNMNNFNMNSNNMNGNNMNSNNMNNFNMNNNNMNNNNINNFNMNNFNMNSLNMNSLNMNSLNMNSNNMNNFNMNNFNMNNFNMNSNKMNL